MRPLALLVGLLLAAGGLAGCFGAEDGTTPASDGGGLGTGGTGGGGTPPVTVLLPLVTRVTLDGPSWVESGTAVSVEASAPLNAQEDVTYTWAVGPKPKTVAVKSADLDARDILPGQTASLKFTAAGVYNFHCHPHPYMLHNVTVVDGYQGPSTVHVAIVDGETTREYRYVPQEVVVGPGTTVVYHNNGTQTHTVTQSGQEPPLKIADLQAASGTLVVEGSGWQRVVAVVQDAEGRIGSASADVYVGPLPADFQETYTFSFPGGGPEEARMAFASQSKTPRFQYPGTVTVNYTVTTGGTAGGTPQEANVGLVTVHLKKQGATGDVLTSERASADSQSQRVQQGTHILEVVPEQGVDLVVNMTVTVVYDLVPPEPMVVSEGGDDHSGHHH